MISKLHRFHGYGSLRLVYRRGQTVRGPLINLKVASRGTGKPYRIAVVVSRKVSKSAVIRNRIRRRIYEIVRRKAGPKLAGHDLVFTVFSDRAADMDAAKLETAIIDLLRKAGLN